ncbi:MAG: GspH/FimT family pseudopilin [Vicinamibacterales bacterium]
MGARTTTARRDATDAGTSLPELLVAAAVVTTLIGMAVPAVGRVADHLRATEAASAAAGWMRLARFQAIATQTNVGLVFDRTPAGWSWRVCRDGTGNGLSRAEIASGADPCDPGRDLSAEWPGVRIALDPTLPGPDGTAPGADPVRFGGADVVSFTPVGTATPGTLFLQSEGGEQLAVRVAGATGRTRVLRYERASRTWRDAGG